MALIHEWLFDETSGTVVADNVGSVNGTITGGVTLNQPSNLAATGLNTAFDFDGVDGVINFGDNLNFDRTDPFTFSVWVKPPVYQFGPILSSLSSTAGFEFSLRAGQKVHLSLTSTGGSGYATIETAINYPVGSWILLTATYNGNGSSSGIKIYINGVDAGVSLNQDTMAASGNMFDSTPMQMGIRGDGSNSTHLNAKIDNLRVYDTALTPAEVLAEYDTYFQAAPVNNILVDDSANTPMVTAVNIPVLANDTITPANPSNELDPAKTSVSLALSNNNTTTTNSGSGGQVGSMSISPEDTGKRQFEVTVTSVVSSSVSVGVSDDLTAFNNPLSAGYGYRSSGLYHEKTNLGSSYGASYTNGDIIGCVIDLDLNELEFYKNGVSQGIASTTIASAPIYAVLGSLGTAIATINLGVSAFTFPIAGTIPFSSSSSAVITIPTAPSNGVAVVALDGISIDYTPAIDFAGVDTFTYDVVPSDGVASVNVNVTQTIANDTATVAEGLSVNIDVLNNDIVSTSSILSIDTQGSLGNAQVQLDNTITYTSTGGVGVDTFTYNIGGDIGQVQVTVTGGIQSDNFTVTVNSANNILDVQGNDSLSGTVIIASSPSNGVAVLSNNDIDYTPNPNFTGTDSMSYEVDGLFATIIIEIVAPVPIAVDDGPFTTAVNTPIIIDVLANDTVF